MFAHIYHLGSPANIATLDRLRTKPWLVELVAEVFNTSISNGLMEHFGRVRFQAALKAGASEHTVFSLLSQWRKMELAAARSPSPSSGSSPAPIVLSRTYISWRSLAGALLALCARRVR